MEEFLVDEGQTTLILRWRLNTKTKHSVDQFYSNVSSSQWYFYVYFPIKSTRRTMKFFFAVTLTLLVYKVNSEKIHTPRSNYKARTDGNWLCKKKEDHKATLKNNQPFNCKFTVIIHTMKHRLKQCPSLHASTQ